MTINGTNDAPVAAADTATTEEDAAVTIDVLRNDKDTDRNDKLTVTSAQVTTGLGVVSVNPDGTVKYDPAGAYDFLKAGDIRQVVITYQVSDGKGGTATSTATVTVMGKSVPVAPVAMDGSAAGDEDIAFSSSVQATDPDSTNLTYSVVDAPQAAQGTLDFKANGTYTFTPAPDFSGTVTFTYKASDGTLDSNVATVTLTVRPVDDAPVAADDVTTTNAGEAVTIDVLANDTDPDGGSKTVEAFTQALGGAVTKDADGNLVYTPYSGFSGQDSFTYTLNLSLIHI